MKRAIERRDRAARKAREYQGQQSANEALENRPAHSNAKRKFREMGFEGRDHRHKRSRPLICHQN